MRRVAGCLLALLLAACGGPAPDAPRAELEAVPTPDLGGVEAVVEEQIQQRRAAAEEARTAAAWGALGRVYHAYDFPEAARAAYANAERTDPRDFRWPYLRGLVLDAASRQEEAARAFERAAELAPADLPTRVRLGDVSLDLGRLDAARQAYERALEIDPESAAARYGLGRAAAEAGHPERAVEHFERVLETQPEAGLVHYRLAQVYRSLGETELAQRHLERRSETGVGFPDPLHREVRRLKVTTAFDVVRSLARDPEAMSEEELVGFAVAQFGDVGGAVEELSRLLETPGQDGDPETRARVEYVVGTLLARLGRWQEAEGHLRRALDLDGDLAAARVRLARALARTERPAEALELLDRQLRATPKDLQARLERATVLASLGRAEDAERGLESLVAERPESGEAWLRLASVRGQRGDETGALSALEQAVRHDLPEADRATAHHRLAELLERSGETGRAETQYRQALAADPGLVESRLALAGLLARTGRYVEAAEAYRRALDQVPEDETTRLAEATALILAGRHGEARKRLEAGLEALPDNPALLRTLARHLAASPERSVRDGPRAVELAQRALEAEPSLENAETLAMAQAEAGRFAQAVATQEEILRRAREAGAPPQLLARLEANLQRYRRGEGV